MILTVHHWVLTWTTWLQYTTGYYLEPHDCSTPLDTTLNHMTAVHHWIVPEAYDCSPQTGSSNEYSPQWILSWTKWMQSTTGSFPEPNDPSPSLNPTLNHMTAVHHWILPSVKWMQSTSGSYPEPNKRSPLLDPIPNHMTAVNHWNHMNAVHHQILSWTMWLQFTHSNPIFWRSVLILFS
jgi:hypothetical protein